MDKVMWAGRFSEGPSKLLNDFNASINVDKKMFREDIEGSIAHATMLGECGIIDKKDADIICSELQKIRDEIEAGVLSIDENAEDIHTFIEQTLTARIGDAGKKLHTARSRNDQVATDVKLFLYKKANEVIKKIADFILLVISH